jgi:hypothetical protein
VQCTPRVVHRVIAQGAVLAATACAGGDLVLPSDSQPATMTADGGTGQSGTVGAPLPDSIAVLVVDTQGRPLAGLSIEFSVPDGGSGQVNPATARTGGDGRARAEWVLGGAAGSQAADARVVGADQVAVRFTATAQPAAAHAIAALSGDGQSATVGTAVPDSLVVRVTDEFGNPVADVQVDWTADPGSISPASVSTDADGRAAARRILGATAGTQTAQASATQLDGSPVVFTQTGMPGSAASLVMISGDGQSAGTGAELRDPVVVRLVDQQGNGMDGQPITWVLGVGGGSVSPETGQTDADGRASARWTLGPAEGTNTLNAVVSGVGVVTFTARATAGGGGGGGGGELGPDHLVFRVQPSDARKGERIQPPVVVAVVDRNGDVVTSAKIKIRLELVSGSGKLGGDRERDTKNGLAEFDDLKVDKPGDGKVLRATAPDDDQLGSVQSSQFRIRED